MRRISVIFFVAIAVAPSAAWPQGDPVGSEFRVNTYTTDVQGNAAMAFDPAGNFIAVWAGRGPQEPGGIYAQRYAASGAPLGSQFVVNTPNATNQTVPVIAADGSGNLVVIWQSLTQDGSSWGIFGQRYSNAGTALGPEFRVNTYTTGPQAYPGVAADAAGNFVVVWGGARPDDGFYGVFGQRYASSGAPAGPEFRVNTFTTNQQVGPSVAVDPSGNFVVVWRSVGQDGDSGGVFGQRYASSGAPVGPEFPVNTTTQGQQVPARRGPSVAVDASGNFVVIWTHHYVYTFGQRYASGGNPVGPEFRVNTYGPCAAGSVAMSPAGDFVVVWSGGSPEVDVFGQRYDGSGTSLGPEFRVNTYTTSSQSQPWVAADSIGRFVVVWDSQFQDGSLSGVFAQRYNMIVPVELMHFRVE